MSIITVQDYSSDAFLFELEPGQQPRRRTRSPQDKCFGFGASGRDSFVALFVNGERLLLHVDGTEIPLTDRQATVSFNSWIGGFIRRFRVTIEGRTALAKTYLWPSWRTGITNPLYDGLEDRESDVFKWLGTIGSRPQTWPELSKAWSQGF